MDSFLRFDPTGVVAEQEGVAGDLLVFKDPQPRTLQRAGAAEELLVLTSSAGVGPSGPPGTNGRGISSIERTSGNGAVGTVDTYTITYNDNQTSTFQVRNGNNGNPGAQGNPGKGITTINRTSGDGSAGSVDVYTITYSDASTSTYQVRNGSNGAPGNNGNNGLNGRGISSVARTSGSGAAGSTDTYTITYSDATTSTFTVVNGNNGAQGNPGNTGPAGPITEVSIGTVTTGASVSDGGVAAASLTGTAPTKALNLTIPTGPRGAPGINGVDAHPIYVGEADVVSAEDLPPDALLFEYLVP